MSTVKQIFILLIVLLMYSSYTQAQEIPNAPNYTKEYKGSSTSDPNDVSGLRAPKEYSPEAVQLVNQIKTLREQNNPAMRNLVSSLNEQLNSYTHNEVTVTEDPDVVFQAPEKNVAPYQSDLIGNSQVWDIAGANNYGVATATEQTGATAGRIWVAVGIRGTGADTVRYFKSDDNGVSWALYGTFTLAARTINRDALDMEIIENTTGEKYIYCSYSCVSGGNQRVGLLVIQSPTFGGTWRTSRMARLCHDSVL